MILKFYKILCMYIMLFIIDLLRLGDDMYNLRYFIFLCVVRDLLIFKVLILDGKMFNFWEMMLK